MTFSERLAHRRVQWRVRGGAKGWRASFHRFQEERALRRRDDPDDVWHCCEHWQRTLMNKWNAREFAIKHGCRVPELYVAASSLAKVSREQLPAHFVIRATAGAARAGVVVIANGVNVLRDEPVIWSALLEKVGKLRRFGRRVNVLVEEFVRTEDGHYELPIEYKFHMFGSTIAAIQVVSRTTSAVRHLHYTVDWEPIADVMSTSLPRDEVRPAPRCLQEMIAHASIMGVAYGDYIRVDFFATDRGAVFNEFAPNPAGGHGFSPYHEELFAGLWERTFPMRR